MTTAQPTARSTARVHDLRLGGCLPDLLSRQVAVQPDATAVISGTESLTYRQLEAAAARLAARLNALGVSLDDCVGLYAEPSLDLMTGVWGVLFAGTAYLPLSSEYPEERLRYMIEDSGTRVIVTQSTSPPGSAVSPRATPVSSPSPTPRRARPPARRHPHRPPATWLTSSTPPAAPAGPRAC